MPDTTPSKSRHPIQPLSLDEHGVMRFKSNAIVEHLLGVGRDHNNGLNELSRMDFSKEDWQQLAQLIGYSLSGYGELNYVDDDAYGAAQLMSEGLPETAARILYLETELKTIRESLREPTARLFGIHPDDLKKNG